jgi:UDP-2,3-diacylglucosamine pyrophosphatase LpxH
VSSTIIVAGDVHLGADNTDVDSFDSFLESLTHRDNADERLVLLGDVLDLIRRDPLGCAWEVSETVTRIKRVAEVMPVDFVFGNHDRYLQNLDFDRYNVDFHDERVLESGDHSIRFRHGESFDRLHLEPVSRLLSGPGDRGDIDPTRGLKDPVVASGRRAILDGRRRLQSAYDSVRGNRPRTTTLYPRRERRAHRYLRSIPEDKLVYGHTHTPYVRGDNAVANPGSWKTTAPVHNTYLVIERGDISLYRHRASGSDERVDAVAHAGP